MTFHTLPRRIAVLADELRGRSGTLFVALRTGDVAMGDIKGERGPVMIEGDFLPIRHDVACRAFLYSAAAGELSSMRVAGGVTLRTGLRCIGEDRRQTGQCGVRRRR